MPGPDDRSLRARVDAALTARAPHVAGDLGWKGLRAVRRLLWRGQAVSCPVCMGSFAGWVPDPGRHDLLCPRCGVRARHRLLWRYLAREVGLDGDRLRILHFAPEHRTRLALQALPGARYTSTDLTDPSVDVRADITALPFEDGVFDLVICSHVLEHVDDDTAAMRELRRVTAPGGRALVLAPQDLARDRTLEDPSIAGPEARAAAYWQADHVRLYGRDLGARLAAAGFEVRSVDYVAALGPDERARHGLVSSEPIHDCRPA